MQLKIDGISVEALCGESLLDIIKRKCWDSPLLSERPLAAKIAGEIFTLNYVPMRNEFESGYQTDSMRRAMAASGGVITLLRYRNHNGRKIYENSMLFILLAAIKTLFPNASTKVNYAIGTGVYVSVEKENGLSAEDIEKIKLRFSEIVGENAPFVRKRYTKSEAIELFEREGASDKAELMKWRSTGYIDLYSYGGFSDYYYGEMLPSTGYVAVWDIKPFGNGLMLIRPDENNYDKPGEYKDMKRFSEAFKKSDDWGKLLECEYTAEINEKVRDGSIKNVIILNEALHEKRFADIAQQIAERDAKIVFISGPSSSGKTTSANRLCIQLRVLGKWPSLISLDNYYKDRDKLIPLADGSYDLEEINAIDVPLFKENLKDYLEGKEVEIPKYNFKTAKRDGVDRCVQMYDDSVLVVEGIHGLNPMLIPEGVKKESIFKMYVSPLVQLNLDKNNRIPTTNLRMLRRIVRDSETRKTSVSETYKMWGSVRRGEEKWIFPYQENADVIFDSSLVYEFCVLKKHIFPLLDSVTPEDEAYSDIRAIVKFLNYFESAELDEFVPPTSLLREFIGGNIFYKEIGK